MECFLQICPWKSISRHNTISRTQVKTLGSIMRYSNSHHHRIELEHCRMLIRYRTHQHWFLITIPADSGPSTAALTVKDSEAILIETNANAHHCHGSSVNIIPLHICLWPYNVDCHSTVTVSCFSPGLLATNLRNRKFSSPGRLWSTHLLSPCMASVCLHSHQSQMTG